jgi:hypothetical protein
MSNESFLHYSVNRDVIHDYLRLLADKNIKERNANIALAEKLRLSEDSLAPLVDKNIKEENSNIALTEKLRLSEDSFAALQQELLIVQEKLALIESNQLPCDKKNANGKDIKQDEYGDYYDWVVHGVTQRFRWMSAGSFLMGSRASEEDRSDDETQHRVTLTQGFWMADTACTQDLWVAVMGDNPADFSDDLENPVENVSWDDVQIFLQRINDLAPEMVVRLPSEAEWEYACRAGTTSAFSFGMEIDDDQVNYDSNFGQTVPVKVAPANPWGLYQMHGNVWEWCQDWYDEYPTGSVIDPSEIVGGTERVLRGGSWSDDGEDCRSAYRFYNSPDSRDSDIGFRFALSQVS